MILYFGMVSTKYSRNFQDTSGQQASRLKSPPKKIAPLIELVNMIPPECELLALTLPLYEFPQLDFNDFTFEALGSEWFIGGATLEDVSEVYEPLLECLKGLPKNFRNYILSTDVHEEMKALKADGIGAGIAVLAAARRYVFFKRLREAFITIAKHHPNSQRAYRGFPHSLLVYARIREDSQGMLRLKVDPLAEAIDRDDVEAARIRECEVCQRIFWAGRIDQWCCNSRCADILRKRNKRRRDTAEKTAANRLHKKKQLAAKKAGRLITKKGR